MRKLISRSLLPALLLAIAAVCTGTTGAEAQQVRWPRETQLPKPAPLPAPPPAVLERAPSAVTFQAAENQRKANAACKPGRTCVVCVAACDGTPPVVVQTMKPLPTGAIVAASIENDSDGVATNAPKYARQDWAGITCGTEGGCSVSGVSAPRGSRSYDVRMTIFSPFSSSDGSTSRYIDR